MERLTQLAPERVRESKKKAFGKQNHLLNIDEFKLNLNSPNATGKVIAGCYICLTRSIMAVENKQ
ncbi:MAG: hypothetical protein F6K00_02490 [Leptolyngbya sp. SIOISBB]|nr:hypothetical protein [Leptolyngbya sp. SIOISBB]